MLKNLKKLLSYYKPYMGTFLLDMFFAVLASAIALVIPLIVRYITSDVVYMQEGAKERIIQLGIVLVVLVIVQFISNYYIANVGHVMGAKMEYNMRAEIFAHYQKLSFSFFDDQKVGQLMSRITNDLFDITELLHHGPENIVISLIKIVGAFIILMGISKYLTAAAFIMLPLMFIYVFFLNRRMRKAFKANRQKVAEINSRTEDNLSGIRVVKSFANEDIEMAKFKEGNDAFLKAKKNSYLYLGLRNYIRMDVYDSVDEFLKSGNARKGDVIYLMPVKNVPNADCHVGVFWGDTPSDNVLWSQTYANLCTTGEITYKFDIAKVYVFPLSRDQKMRKDNE